MVRPLALAADRHRPAQAAFDQPPDAAFIDVQGRVEVQVRAVGHIHHDGVSHPFAQVGFVLVGEENNGHGAEIHQPLLPLTYFCQSSMPWPLLLMILASWSCQEPSGKAPADR